MKRFFVRLYCLLHWATKALFGRAKMEYYTTLLHGNRAVSMGVSDDNAITTWLTFICKSVIPSGIENAGMHYAGYIAERERWCLPSWIWTNAAIVRLWCRKKEIVKAQELASWLMNRQMACGGWVVRNDYTASDTPIPILAPNDSAYIANNAFLELYIATGDEQYLQVAENCARWIVQTAREDGMVYVGYDMSRQQWQKKYNIVDVGFTAGLFARLYEITQKAMYLSFLEQFVERYVTLFYNPDRHGFTTSLDANDHQIGGMFARGQAWALEGLVPAYRVLRVPYIRQIIKETINTLLQNQYSDGGWAYNLTRPLMGDDCKGISVIACNMMEWYRIEPDNQIMESAKRALVWCEEHTRPQHVNGGGGYLHFVWRGPSCSTYILQRPLFIPLFML